MIRIILAMCIVGLVSVHAADRPNILFIVTDQQFADVMSCRMGKQYINTPVMDGLAAQGMLFTRAYSSNPLCMPYRNSVFTGRYPHQTGVTRNERVNIDTAEFVDMGTYFRQAGYHTAYFGKRHLFFRVEDGFRTTVKEAKDNPDAATALQAVDFLSQKHDQPFLLVVSFLNPHNICEWARRLAGRQQRLNCGEIGTPPPLDQLPPAPFNLAPPRNEPDGMTLMRRAYQVDNGPFPVGKFTPDDWRKLRWGYYRMIELVDAQIGRVTAALRQAGLEENTLIIFTSDHGECAGAHGFNQKTVLYEESARVPLIISWKGKTTASTSDKLVNTGIDILPTMMDAAGIPAPEKLPGRSLLPVALGKEVPSWREYIVVENDMSQAGTLDGFHPEMQGRMVRTERFKYCVYSHGERRESLVDLDADPGEMKNLAGDPEYRKTLLEHRALLEKFAKEHNDPLAAALVADDVKPIPFASNPKRK